MQIMLKKLFTLLLLIPSYLLGYIDEPYHETAFIGPGSTFYGLTYYSYYQTDHFWNQNGKKLDLFENFRRHTYRLDLEYALNTKNSFFLKGGYTTVEEKLNGNSRGIEDPEISWQRLLKENDNSALSFKATFIIPVGQKKSCVRYGKFGGEAKLLYSRTFNWLERPFWYDLTLGYRAYNGYPSDQARASASLGCQVFSRLWLIGSSQLYYGLFNGHSSGNFNRTCLNPNFRLLNTQFQCIVDVYKNFSITLGGYAHLWGENIGSGGGFYSGLWAIF